MAIKYVRNVLHDVPLVTVNLLTFVWVSLNKKHHFSYPYVNMLPTFSFTKVAYLIFSAVFISEPDNRNLFDAWRPRRLQMHNIRISLHSATDLNVPDFQALQIGVTEGAIGSSVMGSCKESCWGNDFSIKTAKFCSKIHINIFNS